MTMARRFVGVMAGSFGGRKLSNVGANGTPGTRKPGNRRDDEPVAPCALL